MYELLKLWPPVINTNILHYMKLYIETIEAKILFGQRLTIDSIVEDSKVGRNS